MNGIRLALVAILAVAIASIPMDSYADGANTSDDVTADSQIVASAPGETPDPDVPDDTDGSGEIGRAHV